MLLYEHPLYRENISECSAPGLDWVNLKNAHILITGATGLVGSFFVDAIMERNRVYGNCIQVTILVRNEAGARQRFAPYLDDITFGILAQDINTALTGDTNFDYIIHAASNTHPVAYANDPIGTMTTNIIGTNHLLQYGVAHNICRFIFLSTVEIYGEPIGNQSSFSETDCGYIDCNALRAGYPESKRAGESLCNAYGKQCGLDFVIPRLCRIYGPTMLPTDSKAIAQFLHKGLAGEDIILKSEGNQYYSFCHVADAVRALLYVMVEGKSGEAYNISDKRSDIRLRDLAALVARLSGTKVFFDLPSRAEVAGFSKVQTAILKSDKINELGWRASYDIEAGVENTLKILKQIELRS